MIERENGAIRQVEVKQDAVALHEFTVEMRERYEREGKRIAMVVDQKRGGLINFLMGLEFVDIYPLHAAHCEGLSKSVVSVRGQERSGRCPNPCGVLPQTSRALYPMSQTRHGGDARVESVVRAPARIRRSGDAVRAAIEQFSEGLLDVFNGTLRRGC